MKEEGKTGEGAGEGDCTEEEEKRREEEAAKVITGPEQI